MSGKGFDPRFMEELKQKNNIVEVISSYVALDKKGATHWACCPFHHERTPSFAVNEDGQYYHCFGCGVSGDVIKFVQEIESTDFMGAVRILAARAKMTVPENNFDTEAALEQKRKRERLIKITLDSAKFYLSNLYGGHADAHLSYIASRKLSPTTVKKFGLGASLDFFSLPDYLSGKGYTRADLLESGVLSESKSGKLVDSQAGRLIFPIINSFDEVIAFGGRLLEKSDFAKYKNTKETLLFNKRKNLYNINLLKKLKREKAIQNVIMVEGYMDTLSLYQAGFQNVVASMGTSLTKEQARLLKRYSDKVYISYDGDFAGQNADLRGLEILKEEDLSVQVVPLPDGLDPDDVVKQGADAYQRCLDKALPLIDYKIHSLKSKFDLSRTEEKRKFLSEALKVVKEAESESEKEELLKYLRDQTGITYQSLERDLSSLSNAEQKTVSATKAEKGDDAPTDKFLQAERFVLSAKLFSAPYAKDYRLDALAFDEPTHQIVAEYIKGREEKDEKPRASDLFEVLDEDSAEFSKILDLNYGDKLSGERAEKYFFDSVNVLEKEQIGEAIKRYTKLFAEEEDLEKRKEIALKIDELTKKKNQKSWNTNGGKNQ